MRDNELLPRSQEFATVGHLYRGIADGLRMLVARVGERAVFVGSPRAQATPELLRWPQLIMVTDLDEAAWALSHERMSLLADHCAAATLAHGQQDAVLEAQQRAAAISSALAAHVSAEIRGPGPSS